MSTEEETKTESSMLDKFADRIRTGARPIISLQDSFSSAFKKPRPPTYSPYVDEQLQRDLMESERNIGLLQMEIEMVRELLELKEDELLDDQNRFRNERKDLLERVDVSVENAAQRDKELKAKHLSEQKAKEKEFQREIKKLSDQLMQKKKEYLNEKDNAKKLKKNLDEVQETLKDVKLQHGKENEALTLSLEEERERANEMEAKLLVNEIDYDNKEAKLLAQVKQGKEKLKKAQEYLMEREEMMKSSIGEEKEKVATMEQNLNENEESFSVMKAELQESVKEFKEEFKKVQVSLREKDKVLQSTKEKAEKKIMDMKEQMREKDKLLAKTRSQLLDQITLLRKEEEKNSNKKQSLVSEKEKFHTKIEELRKTLTQEQDSAKLTMETLQEERRQFESDKKEMQSRIDESEKSISTLKSEMLQAQEAFELERLAMAARAKAEEIVKTEATALKEEMDKMKEQNKKVIERISALQLAKENSDTEAKLFEEKYNALFADHQKVQARASHLNARMNEIKNVKQDLVLILEEAQRTKDESIAKVAESEAKYDLLLQENARLLQILRNRDNDASNSFGWAVDGR